MKVKRKESPAFGHKHTLYCKEDHQFKEVFRAKHRSKVSKNTEHKHTVSESVSGLQPSCVYFQGATDTVFHRFHGLHRLPELPSWLRNLKSLRLLLQDLIPVDIKMHSANNNNNICILGATILRLTGKDNRQDEDSTWQSVMCCNRQHK